MTSTLSVCLVVLTVLLLSVKISHGPCPVIQGASSLPLWEVIEEHPDCYELVFVLDDSGYGVMVVAPRGDADPAVLDLCRRHAYAP